MKKMILLSMVLLTALLSGCATRGFVQQRCWETNRQARQYTLERNLISIQYTSDVEDDLASLKRSRLNGIDWDQFEKDCDAAIKKASTKTDAIFGLQRLLKRTQTTLEMQAISRALGFYLSYETPEEN